LGTSSERKKTNFIFSYKTCISSPEIHILLFSFLKSITDLFGKTKN
jgi:hypothetical protein